MTELDSADGIQRAELATREIPPELPALSQGAETAEIDGEPSRRVTEVEARIQRNPVRAAEEDVSNAPGAAAAAGPVDAARMHATAARKAKDLELQWLEDEEARIQERRATLLQEQRLGD
jgi:hypothetical protein